MLWLEEVFLEMAGRVVCILLSLRKPIEPPQTFPPTGPPSLPPAFLPLLLGYAAGAGVDRGRLLRLRDGTVLVAAGSGLRCLRRLRHGTGVCYARVFVHLPGASLLSMTAVLRTCCLFVSPTKHSSALGDVHRKVMSYSSRTTQETKYKNGVTADRCTHSGWYVFSPMP